MVHLGGVDAGVDQRLLEHPGHVACSELVHLFADHRNGGVAPLSHLDAPANLLLLGREGELQVAVPVAVAVHLEAEQPRLVQRFRGGQHHGPRPVGKEHTRVPVLPVHPAREGVGPDHEGVLRGPVVEELPSGHRREEEPRARRRQVHCKRVLGPDSRRHRRRVPKHVLGRARRHDDHVNVFTLEPRLGERPLGGPHRQGPHSVRPVEQVPCLDARSRLDPL
mmetsp:Transcript_4213/g.10770  ORF Transcript_4213/g.10770 Transcript_4213/m.10770 type:complete len:222 (-) Transcript_4213:385-1050(-)